jgi:hypothetical protein
MTILVVGSPDFGATAALRILLRRASSRSRARLPRVGAVSGLLHPVGPESVQTSWARRALVFVAAAVLASLSR